ncbi:MAG: FAD-dependent oxidoreductase, partial [Rhodobacterales bacterium]|nr:FAD-dependent oxidoreductase [Rhodobacterales bacterium]
DGLPCLGAARASTDVIHAFGHGHLGVTLAPRTASVVADLVAGKTVNLSPSCRPGRFSGN